MGQANREARLHPQARRELGTYTLLLLTQVRVGGKIKQHDRRGHGGCGAGAGRRAVDAVAGAYADVERDCSAALNTSAKMRLVTNHNLDTERVIVTHG